MSNIPGASPYAANQIVAGRGGDNAAKGGQSDEEAAALGDAPQSPRQRELSRRYSYYRCANYDDCTTNWNGNPIIPFSERAAVAHEGYLPPGFNDMSGSMTPLEFRKPYAPYYIIRIIVNRFTGLLFSERRTPQITVLGDEMSTDYIQSVAEVGKLWASMRRARRLGGSMGTGVVSFALVNGRPLFEVHDPRWCWPTFIEGDPCRLKTLDKRYLFRDWLRDPNTGEVIQDAEHPPIESWFWYRRFIDATTDTVWSRVPVQSPNDFVDWDKAEKNTVSHSLGRCPARWIQNLPSEENELDGEPDAWGIYDLTETHDTLMSQATVGTIANCTPTVHIATEDPISEIGKGPNEAIKTEAQGKVAYLEMTGAGPKTALELAREHRELAFELCSCVPDRTSDGPEKTATEVLARLSSMLERGGELRDQWGDAIKDLLEIALVACRNSTTPKTTANGITQGTIALPPKVVEVAGGPPKLVERKLGPGTYIDLKWPSFYEPSLEDITKAANAAGVLKEGEVLDLQTLVEFLQNYFPINDPKQVMQRLKEEVQSQQDDVESKLIEGMMRRQSAKTGFETKAEEHGVKLKATGMGGFEVTGQAKPKPQMNGKPAAPPEEK